MTDLIQRLKDADGADRELDFDDLDPRDLNDAQIACYLEREWEAERLAPQDWIDEAKERDLIQAGDPDLAWDPDPSIEWFEFSAKGMRVLRGSPSDPFSEIAVEAEGGSDA